MSPWTALAVVHPSVTFFPPSMVCKVHLRAARSCTQQATFSRWKTLSERRSITQAEFLTSRLPDVLFAGPFEGHSLLAITLAFCSSFHELDAESIVAHELRCCSLLCLRFPTSVCGLGFKRLNSSFRWQRFVTLSTCLHARGNGPSCRVMA